MERPDPPGPGTLVVPPGGSDGDLSARLLEVGLCVTVIVAPLPFGAVEANGRLMLESLAAALALVWFARAWSRPTPFPSTAATIGVVGLLALACLQAAPLSSTLVARISPASLELRETAAVRGEAAAAEASLLGVAPGSLDRAPAISLDPGATASAIRSGATMAALLLVAATVAAARGVRRLAFCLLISGSLQGLYGMLVLASGHDRIWSRPKLHYLEAATGTFINKNHFACFLAMTLACGLALTIDDARLSRSRSPRSRSWAEVFSDDGSRRLLWSLLALLALAGMLLSLSRAGIAVGLGALALTWFAATRGRPLRMRAMIALLVLAFAAVPLVQIGSERLIERYSQTTFDLTKAGARAMVWGDTLEIAAAFPLTGSGFGTFATVYPTFRSPEVRLYFAHAHNDPLQALAEGGIVGTACLLLVLVPLLLLAARALGGAKGTLAVGFAAGLLAVLLHSVVDFDFRIPANAAIAAILAGALYGLPWTANR